MSSRVTRRTALALLLSCAPALAACTQAPPTSVPPAAAPEPEPPVRTSLPLATSTPRIDSPPPTTVPTSPPSTIAPAQSPPAVAPARTTPSETPRPDPSILPLRTVGEASRTYSQRVADATGGFEQSDLEKLLKTPLAESMVGFVNGHHFVEAETKDLGHFSFALNPLYLEATDGRQRFAIFGNSPNFLNYRSLDLTEAARLNFDRAVWAVNNGRRVGTIIQLDNELSDGLLRHLTESRARLGFRIFVVGNEFNDPGAHWRYNFPRLIRAAQVVRDTLTQAGVKDAEVYTPSLAYFEIAKHLDSLLTFARGTRQPFPYDGVSLNYYGAAESIRAEIEAADATLKRHGLDALKLRIGELGNPIDTFKQDFGDEQLAYNYFPQAIALALSTRKLEAIDVYSVFEFGRAHFSLAYWDGVGLKPKPSYQAASLTARVLARIRDIDYEQNDGFNRIIVRRSDGLRVWLVWSSIEGRELLISKPEGAEVYGALGNRLVEDRITLTPRPHAALAGTAKYVVLDR